MPSERQAQANQQTANTKCDTPEELDLIAQRVMAHWTRYIGVFTALGLFVLIGTLIEARLSGENVAEVTRDIGQKQTRAYLSLGNGRVKLTYLKLSDGEEPYLTFEFEIRNTGQSPAQNLTLQVKGWIRRDHGESIPFFKKAPVIDISATTTEKFELDAKYAEPAVPLADLLEQRMARLSLWAIVRGTDVFDQPIQSFPRAYFFDPTDYRRVEWNDLEPHSGRPKREGEESDVEDPSETAK